MAGYKHKRFALSRAGTTRAKRAALALFNGTERRGARVEWLILESETGTRHDNIERIVPGCALVADAHPLTDIEGITLEPSATFFVNVRSLAGEIVGTVALRYRQRKLVKATRLNQTPA